MSAVAPTPGWDPTSGQYTVPQNMQLQQNPQLPQTPAGAATDAQYEAELAALKFDTAQQYGDTLRQLGYTDPTTGAFIPGTVEQDAYRSRVNATQNQQLAVEDVTNQMQQAGTLFSGYRGTAQARAERPYVSALADLDIQVPRTLTDLYNQAGNILQQFTIKRNQALADAASRMAAAATQNPPGTPGAGSGGSATPPGTTPPPGGSTAPPPSATPPPAPGLPQVQAPADVPLTAPHVYDPNAYAGGLVSGPGGATAI